MGTFELRVGAGGGAGEAKSQSMDMSEGGRCTCKRNLDHLLEVLQQVPLAQVDRHELVEVHRVQHLHRATCKW